MSGYEGPNGRRYVKPRKRWPMLALTLAVAVVAGVSTYAMRPMKTASATPAVAEQTR